MTFKSILVHMNDQPRCVTQLTLALELARKFDAHLIGLHVDQYPLVPRYALEGSEQWILESLQHEGQQQTKRAEELFLQQMARTDFTRYEWRAVEGIVESELALHGRYADLLVVGQTDPDAHGFPLLPTDFPAALSLNVARPVLAIPYTGSFSTIAEHVLIGWNGSREATRAVQDALPFLQQAKRVTVLCIKETTEDMTAYRIAGSDLALYLARHNVPVEVQQKTSGEIDIGEQLLSCATDLNADLLVLGTYGHWRMRELALGGVTHTLACEMTLPTLMSH